MIESSVDKYILTKKEIEEYEGIEKEHFLNSNALRRNKSLGDLTGLSAIGFHIIEVEPGHESTELHVHFIQEECIYVLEGKAKATIGDETNVIGAGDFVGYRAGGKAHKLTNTGDSVLRCIVVGQRLAHDVADYPRLAKRIYRNRDMKWNLVDIKDIEEPDAGRKA